jgi:predicted O-methyltransferase YrrM
MKSSVQLFSALHSSDKLIALKDSQAQFLREMVSHANGMLPWQVYEALWGYSSRAPGPNFLEVGTAHGAATIALALGAKSAGLGVRIQTIDRLGGEFSSRSAFGSVEQNKSRVEANFTRANVDENISLFVGTTDEFVLAGRKPERIDLLMLDADGRIDRDLLHFYDVLSPGAVIVIDDMDPEVFLGTTHRGSPYVDLKHRITSLLLAAFEKAGYLQIQEQIGCTAFCIRGERNLDKQDMQQMALRCYRELVFVGLPEEHWLELMQWHRNRADVRQALRIRSSLPKAVMSLGRLIRRVRRRAV